MAVYTETRTYHTKAHMGMIDVTEDFRARGGSRLPGKGDLRRNHYRLYHRRRGGADYSWNMSRDWWDMISRRRWMCSLPIRTKRGG